MKRGKQGPDSLLFPQIQQPTSILRRRFHFHLASLTHCCSARSLLAFRPSCADEDEAPRL